VTFGAALAHGSSGILSKLLALPVFCAAIVLIRLVSYRLGARYLSTLRQLLWAKLALLVVAAVLAIRYGPFPDSDRGVALLTGMTLVCAMAIQNAAHRIHLSTLPPTTLMTGTTTQLMIDLADVLQARSGGTELPPRQRMERMAGYVVAFAAGCLLAAALYISVAMWCFLVPVLVAVILIVLSPSPQPLPSK
jgi:uncharacterized membrane protein YoaK (UPF0700 family)